MREKNRFGLRRHIPAAIRREVRSRSRFGCVVCRSGFYQYEHIEPDFEDAQQHDPARICCLCASCHDAVTRGQSSKALVRQRYDEIQNAPPHKVDPPLGPLDFHDGNAGLLIGGLLYRPAVTTVLRYHGKNVIRVRPGRLGEPGGISAVFTDRSGRPVLWLIENQWMGSLDNWDVEVVGSRITVRRNLGEIALQLRLDPPGLLIVERLDMRYGSAHLLVTEFTYAVGRYIGGDSLAWFHAELEIPSYARDGIAIEFTSSEELQRRDAIYGGRCAEMSDQERDVVLNADAGVMVKSLGISIASFCGAFGLTQVGYGSGTLNEVRSAIEKHGRDFGRHLKANG